MIRRSVLLVALMFLAIATPASAEQSDAPGSGSIVLAAVDAESGRPLTGACYLLWKTVSCASPEEDTVRFDGLPPGELQGTEALAPVGYALAAPFSVQVDSSSTEPITIEVPHNLLGAAAFYESPTWGYIVGWNPTIWRVTEQTTGAGGDRLMMSGSAGTVEFVGRPEDGVDPAACRDTARQSLWDGDLVSDVKLGTDENGRSVLSDGPRLSDGWYQVDYSDGRADAVRITCYALIPGSATLLVTSRASFEQPELFDEVFYGVHESIVFPLQSFVPDEHGNRSGPEDVDRCDGRVAPGSMLDPSGNELARVTLFSQDLRETARATLVLENAGTADLAIDARAFEFQIGSPTTPEPIRTIAAVSSAWLMGVTDPATPIQPVAPGSRAIVELQFAQAVDVEYFAIAELHYAVAEIATEPIVSLRTWTCGGGGRVRAVRS